MKEQKQHLIQHRMTPQRSVLLEELKQRRSHPTADELYIAVRRRLPKVSLGTIYRNLDVLVKNGQIRKLDGHGAQARYDGNSDHHQHIQCLVCSRVDDVAIQLPEQPNLSGTGYAEVSWQVVFTGICPTCQETKK